MPGPYGEEERFVQQIVRRIAEGELKSGERLPTESEMAVEYGMAKTNIHLGIKELKRLGFVSVVPRHAVYVADLRSSITMEGVNAIFHYVDRLPNRAVTESMLELRVMMVCGVVSWMALHPDSAHMERLRERCAALERAARSEDREAVFQATRRFHQTLFLEVGNGIFPLLARSFYDTMSQADKYIAMNTDPVETADVYRTMLECIETGDASAAIETWTAWNDRLSGVLLSGSFPKTHNK